MPHPMHEPWRFDRGTVVAEADPVSLARELVCIATHEHDAPGIAHLAERFDRKGIAYEVREGEHGPMNLVAHAGPTDAGPSILLNSHVDTVPPGAASGWRECDPLGGELRDGCVWGRGAADAKGCLAAMVAAFEMLHARRDRLAGPVTLHAVGREEHGGVGTRTEIARGLDVGAAIVGEPTTLVPMTAHKGCWRLDVVTHGKPVHASRPREGVNAIDKMAGVIDALSQHAREVEQRTHPLVGHASLAVTTIAGGTALNVIPDTCRISIDRRLVPGEDVQQAYDAIQHVLDQRKAMDDELACDLEIVRLLRPAETHSARLVELAERTAGDVLARPIRARGFTASCDMTFLANEAHVPTFIFGPGELEWAHQFDERVPADQLVDATRFYIAMCAGWCAG